MIIKRSRAQGQIIIEYAVVLAAVTAAIIFAAINLTKPSMMRYFNSASRVINASSDQIENTFARSNRVGLPITVVTGVVATNVTLNVTQP